MDFNIKQINLNEFQGLDRQKWLKKTQAPKAKFTPVMQKSTDVFVRVFAYQFKIQFFKAVP